MLDHAVKSHNPTLGVRTGDKLEGIVDPTTANPIAHAVNEENIEEYQKAKRLQLIEEVREIQSFKASVDKHVLCAIVNDAIRVINV